MISPGCHGGDLRPGLAFRTKLSGGVSIVIGALALFTFIYFPEQAHRRATQALMDKARSVAAMAAYSAASALYFDDPVAANEILDGARQFPDVIYVIVTDATGRQFASFDRRPMDGEHGGIASPDSTSQPRQIVVPVLFNNDMIGSVSLGVSLDGLHAEIRKTRLAVALISAILFLGGVAGVFLISTLFTSPLRRMVRVTRQVGGGDLTQRAAVTSNDEIGRLALSFNAMVEGLESARRELRDANRSLEHRVEERTRELQQEVAERHRAEASLEEQRKFLRQIIDTDPSLISVFDRAGRYTLVNNAVAEIHGLTVEELTGRTVAEYPLGTGGWHVGNEDNLFIAEDAITDAGGTPRWLQTISRPLVGSDPESANTLVVSADITARKQAEDALRNSEARVRQTQKLEAVGRLAAGIAHEINTPVQFVTDSVNFVREAVSALLTLIEAHRVIVHMALEGQAAPDVAENALNAEREADLPYLVENVPAALASALEGLDRIAAIVRTMKEFAHPDQKEMAPVDINRAVQSTLTIARNEYKYVADVETVLGDVPPVTCYAGEVNQAILNIVVNAAHAIGAVVEGTEARGTIRVTTRRDGDDALIEISDTGTGIPEEIQPHIFDPFFTTKEVGSGSGQGLFLARSVIVEKHGGRIEFVSEAGQGTTFTMRLPISGPQRAQPGILI